METYMPDHHLFDEIRKEFALKNDAALAKFLKIGIPIISKIRHGRVKFGAIHTLRVYDATNWSIEKIRSYLG